jgi:hypothetical protein
VPAESQQEGLSLKLLRVAFASNDLSSRQGPKHTRPESCMEAISILKALQLMCRNTVVCEKSLNLVNDIGVVIPLLDCKLGFSSLTIRWETYFEGRKIIIIS